MKVDSASGELADDDNITDIENNIHKINSNKEIISIVDDKRVITKERLIQIIESKKRENPKIKYHLSNVLFVFYMVVTSD